MTNKFVVQINSHKQSTIVNGKADTTSTAFGRLPIHIATKIINSRYNKQVIDSIDNNAKSNDGTGRVTFPKWMLRGLVMEWVNYEYEIKNGEFKYVNSDIEDNIEDGKLNSIVNAIKNTNSDVVIETKLDSRLDSSLDARSSRLDGSQIPSGGG
jgi:hypothetical protein